MTPLEVQVYIAEGAADPAQVAAGQWLWRRLLGGLSPENTNAPTGKVEAEELSTARQLYSKELNE